MKTKIVYVVVSSDRDIYLEQAWVSVFSLKHYNVDAHVTIVCDKETEIRINEKKGNSIVAFLDEVISVEFDPTISNKERSRWLKTNLREYVRGDILFIDTDTVIAGNLSEIDQFDFDLGMVYDWHCQLKDRPNQDKVRSHIKSLFGKDLKSETDYFNSGVIYAKDNAFVKHFFERWHQNWLLAKDKPKGMEDQQSLSITIDEMAGVNSITGDYNCQPIVSIKYLATAKILHFFNTKWSNHVISPFYDKRFYQEIKDEKIISLQKQNLILNCKSSFVSPCMIVTAEDIVIWKSRIFKFLRVMYNSHPRMYRLVELASIGMLKIMGVKNK